MRSLLMGGQACVLYGGAEFSRDTDIDVLSVPDLVTAKKTWRDKDWPMITRLIEAHYARHAEAPEPAMLDFWLREARTPRILIDVARPAPDRCHALAVSRPLLTLAADGDEASLVQSLRVEQDTEREADRRYWTPLTQELEQLRSRRTRPETDDR